MSAKRKADEEPQGQSSKKARVDNLQTSIIVVGPIDHTSGPDVQNAFSRFGPVASVFICKKGMGYVRFKHPDAVEVALKAQRTQLPSGACVRAVRKSQKTAGVPSEDGFGWKAQKAVDEEVILGVLRKHFNLHEQIAELCSLVVLDEEEVRRRERYCSALRSMLAPYFPNCSTAVFGSSANGCGAKGCDLDVYLDFGCDGRAEVSADSKTNGQAQLPPVQKVARSNAAREMLWRMPAPVKLKFVRKVLWHHRGKALARCAFINARCPIVRFDDVQTGLQCDINATVRTSVVNTDLVKTYVRAHPAVRPLVVATRKWFLARGLLDPQKRLFSSYAVYALVCCYLQRTKPPVLPTLERLAELHAQSGGGPEIVDGFRCEFLRNTDRVPPSENAADLGDLFKGLLEFLLEINFEDVVVVLRSAALVPRKVFYEDLKRTSYFEAFEDGPMVIQDPIDLGRNITRQIAQETVGVFSEKVRDALGALRRGAGLAELLTAEQRKPDGPENRHSFTLTLSAEDAARFGGDSGEWANEVCDLMLQLLVAHHVDFDVIVRNYATGGREEASPTTCNASRSVVEEIKNSDETAAMLRLSCRLTRAIWEGRNKASCTLGEEDPLEMERMLSDLLWEGAASRRVDFGFEASRGSPSYGSVHVCFFPVGNGTHDFAAMCRELFGRGRVFEIVSYHTRGV